MINQFKSLQTGSGVVTWLGQIPVFQDERDEGRIIASPDGTSYYIGTETNFEKILFLDTQNLQAGHSVIYDYVLSTNQYMYWSAELVQTANEFNSRLGTLTGNIVGLVITQAVTLQQVTMIDMYSVSYQTLVRTPTAILQQVLDWELYWIGLGIFSQSEQTWLTNNLANLVSALTVVTGAVTTYLIDYSNFLQAFRTNLVAAVLDTQIILAYTDFMTQTYNLFNILSPVIVAQSTTVIQLIQNMMTELNFNS